MAYTLNELAADCRVALDAGDDDAALEIVVQCVKKACADRQFVASHLGPDNDVERKILYEDPQHGFCIIAHVYAGAKASGPHDHGPSWAIYGQVEGETEMSDFTRLSAPAGGEPGAAKQVRTYKLVPGDAHLYRVGDLHAPQRYANTRLLRVEGLNMDKVQRDRYVVA